MILIKSEKEIEFMTKAGRIVEKVLDELESFICPHKTTKDLDRRAEEIIKREGGIPAFKGYKGFPGNICTSINNVVIHGIPKEEEILKNGDIISIDVGVKYKEYCADAARTIKVGDISENAQKLMNVTKEALFKGIKEARADKRLSNISHAIQSYVESYGYNVVQTFTGHGIGSKLHEEPVIPNYGEPNKRVLLKSGMTLAIEPMVNEGTHEIKVLSDGWTVVTVDKKLSAHFEHTVLVTEDEPKILTHKR